MREYLVTLLLAAALCYVVTPLVRTWALKFGAVAHIRTRDVHTTPTPRWGGLAMWIAMALTFAMVNHLSLVGKSFGRETLGIFLAATLLVFIGLIDDRFELDALTKLAGQALAAGILLLRFFFDCFSGSRFDGLLPLVAPPPPLPASACC